MERLRKITFTCICICALLLFATISIVRIVSSTHLAIKESNLVMWFGLLACAILSAFFFVAYFKSEFLRKYKALLHSIPKKHYLLCLNLLCFSVGILLFFLLETSYYGAQDRLTYFAMIEELTTYGKIEQYADYARQYDYTFFISLFYVPLSKIFGTSCLSIYVTNLFILMGQCTFLFLILEHKCGKILASAVVAFYCFNVDQMLLIRMPLHEHFFILFALSSIWLIFICYPKATKRVPRFITISFIGVSVFCTFHSNAAGKVLCIALLISLVLKLLFHPVGLRQLPVKHLLQIVAAFLCVILLLSALFLLLKTTLISEQSGIKRAYDPNIWRLIYIGANYESSGSYVIEDVESFMANFEGLSPEATDVLAQKLAIERLKDTYSSIGKGISHLYHKLCNLYGTVSYGYFSVGNTFEASPFLVIFRLLSSAFFVPISFAYAIFSLFSVGNFFDKKGVSSIPLLLFICLFGFTLAMLISECCQKYALNMAPFFLVLGAYGLHSLRAHLQKKLKATDLSVSEN